MDRIAKLNSLRKSGSIDAFLFSTESAVKYLSGFFFYFEHGSSPYQAIPALLAVVPGKVSALILADNESAESVTPGIEIRPYASYRFEEKPDPAGAALHELLGFFRTHLSNTARVGTELSRLPSIVRQALKTAYPKLELVDVTDELASMKCIKDADELDGIRAAAGLADLGQYCVLENARPGITELQLFSLARAAMEASVGARVPLMTDLSTGEGTTGGGGKPTNRLLKPGDLVLSDFTPCYNGYWGDSCNTLVLGKPTDAELRDFGLVKDALQAGIDAVRPGARACDIDRIMRKITGGYGHHSGHGVGTAYHEHPWIVPYEEMELKPDMVIALEPALYTESYGIRLEHLVRVTDSGAELLTQFKHHFPGTGY